VIGARRFFSLYLPDYQQDMLERIWNTKYCILLCSRRTGKTFISAVMFALKAMLYPNIKIGIVAPAFRQAQTVFQEIEDLHKRSPFLAYNCDGEPKHGTTEWHLDFKNGSKISALPFSDNIRSKGFNIIMIDEYGYGENMNQKVKRIISPMIFTKRDVKVDNKDETDIGNQMIIASTATFKWNDYYEKVDEYGRKIEEGNENYDIISYDYKDGLRSGIFEEELVKNEFEDADSLTRKMEYLNIFPDDDDNFISYQKIQKYCIDTDEKVNEEKGEYKEPETQVEFRGDKESEYILTFDDADKYDNFAISIIKLDGSIKRIVRIITMNNEPIQEKIKLIRELLKNFNICKIVCDQRNSNIKDNLAEPYTYNDGEEGAIILDREDEEQKQYVRNKYGSNVETNELIEIYNFSGKFNETRARHFLTEIEHGRVKFPVPVSIDNKKEKEAIDEIKATFSEITAIIPESKGRYTKYDTSPSVKKDRWTVSELGVWTADQYRKGSSQPDKITMGVVNNRKVAGRR
ncbi:MAG: terminase large subunit domain-containing protein, partial [Halanaerobiales bacterium]